jgi:DNA polymerase-3 subunit delta
LLYIFHGEDDFSRSEALTELKQKVGAEELGMANIATLEGQKLSLNELTTTCNTIPFLAAKRLVIVEGLLSRFEQKDRRGRARPELGEWGALKGYIATMPPSTVLVLVDGKLGRDNPLLKELAPKAKVREFSPIRGAELHDWIWSRVGEGGGDISPPALRLLANLVGENLWILGAEIDKLCLYAQGRRIEEDDVRLLVSYVREANIFAMVDAIIQRKLAVASQLLHQFIDEGAAPSYLLFMITRQFRLLVRAKELSPQRLPPAELIGRVGVPSGHLLQRVMEQAQGYSLEQLQQIYQKLLDTDLSIKRGRLKGVLALDLLLAELCQEG